MADNVEHGVKETFYDNLGLGWRMECFCDFMTSPGKELQFVGEEMDDHFRENSPKEK